MIILLRSGAVFGFLSHVLLKCLLILCILYSVKIQLRELSFLISLLKSMRHQNVNAGLILYLRKMFLLSFIKDKLYKLECMLLFHIVSHDYMITLLFGSL